MEQNENDRISPNGDGERDRRGEKVSIVSDTEREREKHDSRERFQQKYVQVLAEMVSESVRSKRNHDQM